MNRGDFTGFTFDGIHSSQLNIVRVSEGDRYEENLFSDIEDKVIEMPGNDGSYYYGSDYQPRSISISIAFDSMTEVQFRKVRKLFSTKKICELIFDERPYKVYQAKVENPIELSYVCFDEREKTVDSPRPGIERDRENDTYQEVGFVDTITVPANTTVTYRLHDVPIDNTLQVDGMDYTIENGVLTFVNETEAGKNVIISYLTMILETPAWKEVTPWKYSNNKERIYKGEGTIEFICYFPYAKSLYNVLDYYTTKANPSFDASQVREWAKSSGILSAAERSSLLLDTPIETDVNGDRRTEFYVYNPGDIDVGFYLYIPFKNGQIVPTVGDRIVVAADTDTLVFDPITAKPSKTPGLREDGIVINTVNHLIEGVQFDPITEDYDGRSKTWQRTGNLYNEYIAGGYFPKIKCNDWYFDDVQHSQVIRINCCVNDVEQEQEPAQEPAQEQEQETSNVNSDGMHIHYEYLYF